MVKLTDELSARFANMSFVCACLVVLIHVNATPDRGSAFWWVREIFGESGIANAAIPCFFLTSGFFLARRIRDDGAWYGDAVAKRVRSLLLPFLLWNVIGWIFVVAMVRLASALGFETGLKVPICAGWRDAAALLGLYPSCALAHPHTWFLRSLFFNVLLSPLVVMLFRRARPWVLCLALLALVETNFVLMTRFSPEVRECAHYFFSIDGLAYFSVGMLLCLKGDAAALPRAVGWLLALAAGVVVVIRPFLSLTCDLPQGEWWNWHFALVGRALLVYAVWRVMPSRRVFGCLAGCAFAIYVMHRFALVLSFGLLGVLGLKDAALHTSILLYFGRVAVSIAVICALTMLLRRLLPRTASVLFGGR